jgi:hypothetical protein
MADAEQLQILERGVECWNTWRRQHPDVGINLTEANLSNNWHLSGVNFRYASLIAANLSGSTLAGADLSNAHLYNVNCICTNLAGADLTNAYVMRSNLLEADLSGANLKDARLEESVFVRTNFSNANLDGCEVFGISAWALILDGASQSNLRITPSNEPSVTVDDLEVAQFIYLMLNNKKVRNVINTITTKAVLILGRFSPERKAILDAMREELREQGYVPIIFDFDRPSTRNMTETVTTLALMSRFIIADITDARCIPHELQAIIPYCPSVPVLPLLLASEKPYGMFDDFKSRGSVLEPFIYESREMLTANLKDRLINAAEEKAKDLQR